MKVVCFDGQLHNLANLDNIIWSLNQRSFTSKTIMIKSIVLLLLEDLYLKLKIPGRFSGQKHSESDLSKMSIQCHNWNNKGSKTRRGFPLKIIIGYLLSSYSVGSMANEGA